MADQVDHPEGFVQFDLVAEALAAAVDPSLLRALRVGPLRLRFSRTVGSTYMSNGCCHCDALQGNFPLMEKLREFQADGGQLEELVVAPIEFPLVALPRFEDQDQ
jgi:competence protein CoiA